MPSFIWSIDLSGMIGKFCRIETLEGVVREGKITNVVFAEVMINKMTFPLPRAIELNRDSGDCIELERMRELVLK